MNAALKAPHRNQTMRGRPREFYIDFTVVSGYLSLLVLTVAVIGIVVAMAVVERL
jgi:hypothetical protein